MTKKTIGLIIIALVFVFPFRWAFLEYPDPINSGGTMIDAGRMKSVFYFLLTVAGFLAFMFMSITGDEERNH